MKSRWTTYLLLAAVVAVWGVVAWRILAPARPAAPDVRPAIDTSAVPQIVAETLRLDYPDPFLKGVAAPTPAARSVVRRLPPAGKAEPKRRERVQLSHLGTVSAGGQTLHILTIGGRQYELSLRDTAAGFRLTGADPEIGEWVYGYDPRVAKIGDKYYVTWCNGYHGPTIGIAWTDDFETFHQLENAFIPFNRNGVLFPRKISGKFAMLSRPSDNGHTAFGDIFYSESPDMEFWGRHRHVMSPAAFEVSAWQCMKIGAGPVPIETSEGWLLFYHGVLRSCNGYVYAFGSALLDLDEPWKVTARSGPYLISPRAPYECMGDVPNVTFPCAALHDPATGRVAVYYGCADTVTGLAFGYIPEIVEFTKRHNIL